MFVPLFYGTTISLLRLAYYYVLPFASFDFDFDCDRTDLGAAELVGVDTL